MVGRMRRTRLSRSFPAITSGIQTSTSFLRSSPCLATQSSNRDDTFLPYVHILKNEALTSLIILFSTIRGQNTSPSVIVHFLRQRIV
ncbi:hypothetical protein GCK32_021624 [Trichostrongylus colubriformis]|uniref:Uncharacterized protein n=1 Tax=Trichostrongylus colubriformis TaxID=6319 RepID=A0AAN8FDL9_TRICO